jgi:hypothetical protein
MQLEKLSLWDRFFNRYRKTIRNKGSETWIRRHYNYSYDGEVYKYEYLRNYVEYTIIDRVTGSETIEKVYLD